MATKLTRSTNEELEFLGCPFGTSKPGRGGRRYLPYVFTEHGVVMLSTVLNSDRAIAMSVVVVSAFVRMREWIASNKDLAARIDDIDRLAHEVKQIKAIPAPRKRRIGFRISTERQLLEAYRRAKDSASTMNQAVGSA